MAARPGPGEPAGKEGSGGARQAVYRQLKKVNMAPVVLAQHISSGLAPGQQDGNAKRCRLSEH